MLTKANVSEVECKYLCHLRCTVIILHMIITYFHLITCFFMTHTLFCNTANFAGEHCECANMLSV